MSSPTSIALFACLALACLVSLVTSIVGINCSLSKKWGCAKASGSVAVVTGGCVASCAAVLLFTWAKTRH